MAYLRLDGPRWPHSHALCRQAVCSKEPHLEDFPRWSHISQYAHPGCCTLWSQDTKKKKRGQANWLIHVTYSSYRFVFVFTTYDLVKVLSKLLVTSCSVMLHWPGSQTYFHSTPFPRIMASQYHLRECAILWDHHCLRTAHLLFLSSRAACVGVRHLVRVSLLWISGALSSLFCLDGPSTFLRFWPGHRQPHLGPKGLWHWIPFEIFRSNLTVLFLPSHGRKVFSYITRKMSLIYI